MTFGNRVQKCGHYRQRAGRLDGRHLCRPAELKPLVFEGAMTRGKLGRGTLPLGQLRLTTEVENYAGFPGRQSARLISTTRDRSRPTHHDHAAGRRGQASTR